MCTRAGKIRSQGKTYNAWACDRCKGRCTSYRGLRLHEKTCGTVYADGPLALSVTAQPTVPMMKDKARIFTWGC